MMTRLLPLKHAKRLALVFAVAALALESVILARVHKHKTAAEPELRPKTVPFSYPKPEPANRAMWVMREKSGDGG
jgi:hypothetical protein